MLPLTDEFDDRNLRPGADADREGDGAYALQGRPKEALQLLNTLRVRHKAGAMPAYDIALVYAGLGDKDLAFHWLLNSHSEHASDLLSINDDLRFDTLRSDPRFRDLLRSVNYPE